jgi:hypothetical protein
VSLNLHFVEKRIFFYGDPGTFSHKHNFGFWMQHNVYDVGVFVIIAPPYHQNTQAYPNSAHLPRPIKHRPYICTYIYICTQSKYYIFSLRS